MQGGHVLRRPFLDISNRVTTGGESGLLSMAFARDYRTSRRFWVYYTDREGFIQIDQFRAGAGTPNRADPASRRSVIRVPHHRFNHKGGQLQVGPDGYLYAGFGDGGGGGDPDENAQNLGRMLAKLIRIDPKPDGGYTIPPDNPFRESCRRAPGDLRVRAAESVPVLLRPPYRKPHDRRRGPGRDRGDRLHPRPLGRPPAARGLQLRLGHLRGPQPLRERQRAGRDLPVLQHTHSSGFCSITGGYVIRDRSLGRGWTGRYVYGDYCDGTLRLATLRRPNARTKPTRMHVNSLVSFGEDSRGRVYAVSLDGPVYRIGRR